jgi:hypothetical protein
MTINQPAKAAHLQWCKQRALEHVDAGDLGGAIASMQSDLAKHPETYNLKLILETMRILLAKPPLTSKKVTDWINGFN